MASSKMTTKKIGFFDLPLELRQQLYDEAYPEDNFITYNPSKWSDETTLFALYCTDSRVQDELNSYSLRSLEGIRITLSPQHPIPPLQIFQDATTIEIRIGHWDLKQNNLTGYRDKIAELATSMKECTRLESLKITFHDDGKFWRDSHWCKSEIGDKSIEWYGSLRTVFCQPDNTGLTVMPIVEYLLRPFLDLPVVQAVGIEDIRGLDETLIATFDHWYMRRLFGEMQSWIMGDRAESFPDPGERLKLKYENDEDDDEPRF